ARVECRRNGISLHPWADGAGRFSIDQIQPGFYTLAAEHEDYLSAVQGDIAAGAVNVRLTLPDAIPVSGRVVDATTGAPLIEHEMVWVNAPEYIRLDELYKRPNSSDGSFQLRISRVGDVRIAARAQGYRMGYADIRVEEGMAPVQNLEIALKPQADLTGFVHDATGQPVVGALVFTGVPERPMDDDFASCRTGSDGHFVLEAQRLGHDSITVTHPEFPHVTVALSPAHFAGAAIDVPLASGATVECTVLQDGIPSKAFVTAVPSVHEESIEGQTGDDGRCMLRGLPAGECSIQVHLMESGAIQEARLTLDEGSGESIDFHFAKGNCALEGLFTGAAVSLYAILKIPVEQREQCYYVFRNEGGVNTGDTFEISNLPSGPASLSLSWSVEGVGHSMEQAVFLTEGAVTELNLDLGALAAAPPAAGPGQSPEG
ncbi:MAG: carboxypeptidase-like regulatory domain-containing protein, partial [Candidatus Hydrogenedentales bacterium]